MLAMLTAENDNEANTFLTHSDIMKLEEKENADGFVIVQAPKGTLIKNLVREDNDFTGF